MIASTEPGAVSTGIGVIVVGALSLAFQLLTYLDRRRADQRSMVATQLQECISARSEDRTRWDGEKRQLIADYNALQDSYHKLARSCDATPVFGTLQAPTPAEPAK